MLPMFVIADDLTGALDTGVQFAAAGLKVRVLVTRCPNWPDLFQENDVVVWDARTRHLPPAEAARAVREAAEEACAAGICSFFKKTDSALRGNPGAELAALLQACGASVLHFVPAFPEMDRVTRDGILFIGGVPVSESAFGQDPFDPVRCSDVAAILSAQTDTPVIRAGTPPENTPADGPRILLYDADSTEALDTVTARLPLSETPLCLAGCAGLARSIARLPAKGAAPALPKASAPGAAPGLAVLCGSLHPVTTAQLDAAERSGFARIHLQTDRLSDGYFDTAAGKSDLQAWADLLKRRKNVILDTMDAASADAGHIPRVLGHIACRLWDLGVRQPLFVTGGDTLRGLMQETDISALTPLSEPDPGVVFCVITRNGRSCPVITKSGGFGAPDLLIRLAAANIDTSANRSTQRRTAMTSNRKILGITMGDPAGIGPEITVKALADPQIYEICRPLVVGDASILEEALAITGQTGLAIHPVRQVSEALFAFGTIDVLDMGIADAASLRRGVVSAEAGHAAFSYVKKVIELAMNGEVDATITNPLNKEALHKAGHLFSGHTEIYAHFTGTDHYTMMLAHENLRVVHVSTHVSLREACDRVKKDRVLEVIRLARQACLDLGIEAPRVGVAGLNPHSGENGLFGREEIEEITPAIEAARAEGIDADGPVPPDTVFSKARGGWYDIVVAMYHDQGHIPLKVVGFVYNQERQTWDAVAGVNITLGLPIIRVSVDHGTAFDQAGKGTASPLSLQNAIAYGVQLAEHKPVAGE